MDGKKPKRYRSKKVSTMKRVSRSKIPKLNEPFEGPDKRGKGRPPKQEPEKEPVTEQEILEKEMRTIKELAELQVSDKDIAVYIRKSVKYVNETYPGLTAVYRLRGQIRLIKAQFDKAYEGNCNMLIWLGKFYLNQRDEIKLNSIEPEVRMMCESIERHANEKASVITKNIVKSAKKALPNDFDDNIKDSKQAEIRTEEHVETIDATIY